jgi:hypothetical protein
VVLLWAYPDDVPPVGASAGFDDGVVVGGGVFELYDFGSCSAAEVVAANDHEMRWSRSVTVPAITTSSTALSRSARPVAAIQSLMSAGLL